LVSAHWRKSSSPPPINCCCKRPRQAARRYRYYFLLDDIVFYQNDKHIFGLCQTAGHGVVCKGTLQNLESFSLKFELLTKFHRSHNDLRMIMIIATVVCCRIACCRRSTSATFFMRCCMLPEEKRDVANSLCSRPWYRLPACTNRDCINYSG
jgi:hypothetical protein